VVLVGKKGRRQVKIETGDLIFERSRETKESAAITAAALPQDKKAASRMGLLGSLSDAFWEVSQKSRARGLSRFQRKKIIIAQKGFRALNCGLPSKDGTEPSREYRPG